jgi:hypothetical protein
MKRLSILRFEVYVMDAPLSREKRATLGTLTPAFLSADDAARYVHERIPRTAEHEYGSVILQRLSDDLFVASQPVVGRASTFDWTQLLDRSGPTADFIDPTGYRIVASLHSHPDIVQSTSQLNPSWSMPQVKAFLSFYSEPDIIFNFTERARFRLAYLSGPDGALLKYQVHDVKAAEGYVNWLKTQGPWTSPDAPDGTLEGAFKKLASVGKLTFLVSSPSWGGSVGEVPQDWQPLRPFASEPLTLPCGPVFPSQDLALNYAQQRIQRQPALQQQVVILQQTLSERYIASEPVAVEPLFDPLPPLPAGCYVRGFYVQARPLPANYPELEDWLYKNFISPMQLARHIAHYRHFARSVQSNLGASLFIRLRDEAILYYRFSGSAAESKLFDTDSDGTVNDNGHQAKLKAGTLLTRAFVRQVAQAGELSVQKTSALWDRLGVVEETWEPYADFPLPGLSRRFLTADDAVRYAHASIGGRRDKMSGGLVLQRSDGRFVVTEPVETPVRGLLHDGWYPKGRLGKMIILHAGHRLKGRYGACPGLSTMETANSARLKWTHQEAELYGQMFTDQEVEAIVQSGLPGYLSGTQDSLISFQPGPAPGNWRQQWQADAAGGMSPIARQLEDGKIKPADVVRSLAEGGTLRVMTGTALWGPAEKVAVDWGPFVRVLEFQRPVELSYGGLFETADAAALDVYHRRPEREQQRYADQYFAFIFKHEEKQEYLASELVATTRKTPLLSLADVSANPVPEGFGCCGVYYSQQWSNEGKTKWLERFFIAPQDLSIAITQLGNAQSPSTRQPSLYIAPPEGVLLRYRSPSTSALFEAQSEGDTFEAVQAKLDSGTLSAPEFVHKVANSGDLQVIRYSHCWDRLGKVTGQWQPYAHIQRRRLSPAFLSMDDAARYVRRRVPVTARVCYGGAILRRDDGWFLATEPVVVLNEVFDIKQIFPDRLADLGLHPVLTSVVALYHSKPARHMPFLLTAEQAVIYSAMFSTRVLAQAMAAVADHMHHYSLGADGSLISLLITPRSRLISRQNVVLHPQGRHDWLHGELERKLRSGELTPLEYVKLVAGTYPLQVVVGSGMWGEPGQVSNWWLPFASAASTDRGYPMAQTDPSCSAICAQPDDAALCVHQQVTTRAELSFGYLLKSMKNGNFTATLPVADRGARFAHRRVFSDVGYPYRYEMAGLYFCVPQHADFHPAGSSVAGASRYLGLFSPADLKSALALLHATASRAALPLYISCADGALLKFVIQDRQFIKPNDLLFLRLGLLSPRDYIRRMASAGELRVLRSSANWPGLGVVGDDWQLGHTRAVADPRDSRLVLGPIHSHAEDAAHYIHGRAGTFSGEQYLGAQLASQDGLCYLPVLAQPDDGFPSAVAERLFPQARFAGGPSPSLAFPLPQLPQGYQLNAAHLVFHAGLDQPEAVGESEYRQYFVSWRELGFYLHELKRKGLPVNRVYLSVRDGALLSYMPRFSNEEATLFDTAAKWSKDEGYSADAPAPSRVVIELAGIGELQVIHPGRFWRLQGKVEADFKDVNGSFVPDKDEL